MLTEAQKNKAEKRLSEYLLEHYGTTIKDTSDKQMYYALTNILKDAFQLYFFVLLLT